MKYYTCPKTQALMAFEPDGSQDHLIDESFVRVPPEAEAAALAAAANPRRPFAEAKGTELASFRADREKMLNRLAGIGMAAQVGGDIPLATAITAFRQGLLDLPGHTTVAAATDIDALKLALKTRYAALLAATPTAAKLAFKGVDA